MVFWNVFIHPKSRISFFQGVLIHLKSRLNDRVLAKKEQWSEAKMLKG